jgi:putative flavoprotein involved in K+ transport
MANKIWDVVIVGAGQAGLNASYFLSQSGIEHIVLERGRIGESWHSQRWQSFLLNSPNKINTLAGQNDFRFDPDGFWTATDFTQYLEHYCRKNQLPIREYHAVKRVEKNGRNFRIHFEHEGVSQSCEAIQIIIASGGQSEKLVPAMGSKTDRSIFQIHAADYRNARQLPDGATLVVGSAQSGCQIAEDLCYAGREVYLSTSNVARIPRTYRGRDILDWLIDMRFFDARKQDIKDPAIVHMKPPQLTATGGGHKTISLQSLAKIGVKLLGKLISVDGTKLNFNQDLAMHVQFADGFSAKVKEMIDQFAKSEMPGAPAPIPDPEDLPAAGISFNAETEIDLRVKNIRSIIWACGFHADLGYLDLPVKDGDGLPVHDDGISPVQGLFFVGFPWLRNRKSALIYGSKFDAEFVVGQLVCNLQRRASQEFIG